MSESAITSVFNDGLIAEQFERYRRDPSSVDETWRQYFRVAESLFAAGAVSAVPSTPATTSDLEGLRKVAAAAYLQQAIRDYGHYAAQLDPLGTPPSGADELTEAFHGLTEADLAAIPGAALGDARRQLRITADGISIPIRPLSRLTLAWAEIASIEMDDRAATIIATDGRSERLDLGDVLNPTAVRDAFAAARTQLDEARHAASASIESSRSNP